MTCPCGSTLPVTSTLYALGIELKECAECRHEMAIEIEEAAMRGEFDHERDQREVCER